MNFIRSAVANVKTNAYSVQLLIVSFLFKRKLAGHIYIQLIVKVKENKIDTI